MDQQDLAYSTVSELGVSLRAGDVTSVAVTELMLERIVELNPTLNAFLTVTGDEALDTARAADLDLAKGRDRGPLHGIPVALKDNFATCGTLTTGGSQLFAEWIPDQDATAVTRLRRSGAVILGKTGLHELAFGYTSINPFYGAIANPWGLERHPGGSSGGSAAAVAAGMAYAALGTDTACSVRQPAHCCGIVGFKPTFGLVSKHGVLPLAWTLDHVGILARSVDDAACLFDVVAGPDPLDPYSNSVGVADLARPAPDPVTGVRIGVPRDFFYEGGNPEVAGLVDEALAVLADLGADLVEVEIPHLDSAAEAFRACRAEILAVYADDLSARPEMFSDQVRESLSQPPIDAVTYVKSQYSRQRFGHALEALTAHTPILATPTAVVPAGSITDPSPPDGHLNLRNTVIFSLTGQPSISVCCGFIANGLPVGLMLTGAAFSDRQVLALAAAYEQATHWHVLRPPHG